MPKGSEKLTAARKEEIIDACAKLYETMPFKNITLGEIGAQTTFTRTSIYNYFRRTIIIRHNFKELRFKIITFHAGLIQPPFLLCGYVQHICHLHTPGL